jgi:pSer/pThr/pTyr-binding forkhead associated (FHA) protein
MQICPDCHSTVDDEAIFCDQCGFQLKARPAISRQDAQASQPASTLPENQGACLACGYHNPPGEVYCANCGVQLLPAQTQSELAPAEKPNSMDSSNPVSSGAEIKICPTCGSDNPISADFCDNCGFWLTAVIPALEEPPVGVSGARPAAQPGPAKPAAPVISAAVTQPPLPGAPSAFETMTVTRSVGRLFSTSTNTSLPLPPQAEIILGRRDPDRGIYPDVDLSGQGTAGNSVSRQHARLLVQGSQVYVEDLNSTNATYLNRQKLQPGQRYLLNNGDELRLGGVALVYYAA